MIAASDVKAKDSDNVVTEFLVLIGAALGIGATVVGMILALIVAQSFVDAWAFTYLWRWFALPLGAPALGYWAALGLLLIVRYARPAESEPDREGQGKVKNAAARFVMRLTIYPAVVLGLGAFAHRMLTR